MSKTNSPLYYVQKTSSVSIPGSANWVPNTDVYISETTLVVKVELAGMRQEDLELSVNGSRLTIRGERSDGCRTRKCKFLVMEINYGRFECVVEIPKEYNLSLATATYRNGFLRVDIPKSKAATTTTRIAISAGE